MTQESSAPESHPLLPLFRSANPRRLLVAGAVLLALIGLLYLVRGVAGPVLAAAGIAYIVLPIVEALERRRCPRALAVSLLMLAIAVGAAIVSAFLVPTLIRQVGDLVARIPRFLAAGLALARTYFPDQVPENAQEILADARDFVETHGTEWISTASRHATRALKGGASALGRLLSLLFIPIFMFFFLLDWNRFAGNLRDLLPRPMQPPVWAKLGQIDRTLSSWLRGVLTVATILAVGYATALSFLGVPLGLLIGVLAGYAYVVPFLSGIVGIGLGVLFCLLEFSGWGQIAAVVVVFAAGASIEGILLTPRIVGDSLGLPAVIVILAIMLGGELFGFVGVLLALPAAAAIKVVGDDLLVLWKSSEAYRVGVRSRSARPPTTS